MQRGFSLIELSIVLVILGLLTGSILAAQSLIRASELRGITADYQRYVTAVQSFRDKYIALPGDMTNATSFWGTMTNCGVASPSGTGTQTCNGNGDGMVYPASAASRTGEMFGFWKQLANAGLIEGNYSGIASSGSQHDTLIGDNTPASKINNVGWSTYYHGNTTGVNEGVLFALDYGNNLTVGTDNSGGINEGKAFTPAEAWSIDLKLDDGKPGTGRMAIRFWDDCSDAASNGYSTVSDRTSASYALTDTSKQCAIYFPKWI